MSDIYCTSFFLYFCQMATYLVISRIGRLVLFWLIMQSFAKQLVDGQHWFSLSSMSHSINVCDAICVHPSASSLTASSLLFFPQASSIPHAWRGTLHSKNSIIWLRLSVSQVHLSVCKKPLHILAFCVLFSPHNDQTTATHKNITSVKSTNAECILSL